MDMLLDGKNAKLRIIIIVVSAMLFLLAFPIFAVYFQNTTTAEIITTYGYEGVAVYEGGNNYLTIPDESEELLKEHLATSGLWHTSIESSNEAQVLWYKELSKRMEETSVGRARSNSNISTTSVMNPLYLDANSCERDYMGSYANDECDYNGIVKNSPSLKTYNPDDPIKSCTNGNVYEIYTNTYNYYESNESSKIVGGKILGLYPDVLVSSSLANTYSALDQNDVVGLKIQSEKDKIEDNLQENIEKYGSMVGMGIISSISGIIASLTEKLISWYKSFDNVASATSALDDIFSEGALYSTFNFTPESKCQADDLIWYVESSIPDDYECDLSETVYTDYTETITCDKDEEGNDIEDTCTTTCTATTPVETDGKNASANVAYPGPKSYYVDTKGSKHCLYKKGADGKEYKLDVKWICNIESAVPNIKCTNVTPIKDEEETIQYYLCSGISESEVRTKIVDPVLDAYENNTLQFNEYMTKETVNKFIYGFDEEKYQNKINPKDFKIDEETRKIITKHIVMEILGETEERRPAIADEEGNFYLQSVNRVLNQEQYKEALNETILVKDNILRKEASEKNQDPDKDKMYSEKLYGVFYSEYNSDFNEWTKEQIENQKIKDKSTKASQIMEIFSTYEYITYYLKEYGSVSLQTTGTGLAQVDASGFQQRVSAPSYSGYWDNGINIYYGECPWYALGRVREILANAGSDYNWTYAGNGGTWCDSVDKDKDNFIVVRDYLQAKPGSIVSWKDASGGYGHVAIVEEVTSTTVTISESFISLGIYSSSARSLIYSSGYNHAIATKNCSKNGCWQRRTLTYDQMRNSGWNGYQFQCYIQLLKDEEVNGGTTGDVTQ